MFHIYPSLQAWVVCIPGYNWNTKVSSKLKEILRSSSCPTKMFTKNKRNKFTNKKNAFILLKDYFYFGPYIFPLKWNWNGRTKRPNSDLLIMVNESVATNCFKLTIWLRAIGLREQKLLLNICFVIFCQCSMKNVNLMKVWHHVFIYIACESNFNVVFTWLKNQVLLDEKKIRILFVCLPISHINDGCHIVLQEGFAQVFQNY